MRFGSRLAFLVAFASGVYQAPAGAQEGTAPPAGHVLGDAAAQVTVVEFADFACTACGEFWRDTWPQVRMELVETGRVAWRHVPIVFGFRHGDKATRAAECAADQGAFWAMHDRLFAQQSDWMGQRNPDDRMKTFAAGLELNAGGFDACYDKKRPKERIRSANRAAKDAGVRATPTFLINGRPVIGALDFEHFLAVVEQAERDAKAGGASQRTAGNLASASGPRPPWS